MSAQAKGGTEPRRRSREQALALLQQARCLIASSDRFTRGAWARERHSHPVRLDDRRAVRFCAAGALLRAAINEYGLSRLSIDRSGTLGPAALQWALTQLGLALARAQLAKGDASVFAERGDVALLDPAAPTRLNTSWLVLVAAFNLRRTISHGEILAAFDEAISNLEQGLRQGRRAQR